MLFSRKVKISLGSTISSRSDDMLYQRAPFPVKCHTSHEMGNSDFCAVALARARLLDICRISTLLVEGTTSRIGIAL